MIGELIIWNLIGMASKAHNKKVQENLSAMFPKTNFESTPKIQNIQNKPFSQYLEEAMSKIR